MISEVLGGSEGSPMPSPPLAEEVQALLSPPEVGLGGEVSPDWAELQSAFEIPLKSLQFPSSSKELSILSLDGDLEGKKEGKILFEACCIVPTTTGWQCVCALPALCFSSPCSTLTFPTEPGRTRMCVFRVSLC